MIDFRTIYAGQWVAWDPERTTILAHGRYVAEVRKAAVAMGELDPLLEKVPRLNAVLVGF